MRFKVHVVAWGFHWLEQIFFLTCLERKDWEKNRTQGDWLGVSRLTFADGAWEGEMSSQSLCVLFFFSSLSFLNKIPFSQPGSFVHAGVGFSTKTSDCVLSQLGWHHNSSDNKWRASMWRTSYCNPGNFSKLINLVNWRFWHFISY